MTTPTKRLRMKREPMIMNKTKYRVYQILLFMTGVAWRKVVSTPYHIMSTHPSVVTAVNKVNIELITLSKLAGGLIHSPPASIHSHIVTTFGLELGMLSV